MIKARSIWELVGSLYLSLYHAEIAAVEGRAGRVNWRGNATTYPACSGSAGWNR
jgi:hypothetical protein